MSWQVVRIVRTAEGEPFVSYEQAQNERDRLQRQDPSSTFGIVHDTYPLEG